MAPGSIENTIEELKTKLIEQVLVVEDRVSLIQDLLKTQQNSREDINVPEVLFDDWSQDEVAGSENFSRGIIKTLRDTDKHAWEDLLKSCTSNQSDILSEFTAGKALEEIYQKFDFGSTRGTRQELGALESAEKVELPTTTEVSHAESLVADFKSLLTRHKQSDIGLYEDPGHKQPLLAYENAQFSNWGQNVRNKPLYTLVPKTKYGVQQIVQYAAKNDCGVRVSGYRHSWSPSFARDKNCILISTLDLHTATTIPNTASLAGVSEFFFSPQRTELNQIQLLNSPYKKGDQALVRVGCSTTNEQLRSWCIEEGLVTLPLNVIMVEITFGGSNAPICHGAGRRHKTLSDLVRQIEYVDAHGNFQVIDNKDDLRVASGCFGLIGVITHLTLELDPMSYAVMKPAKIDVIDAIPPPPSMPRSRIPKPLYQERTDEQIRKAQEDFENRATNHYYAEWFWFPYSNQMWINTWDTTEDKTNVKGFPSKKEIVLQWIQAIAMEAAQKTGIVGLARTSLVSRIGMAALPSDQTIKTWLPDALHFRRAIQNTRVRDMELEIPLLPRRDDNSKPDFAVVQQAWWDAILKTYEYSETSPMRMPLEMRIMGGSDVVMAPQRGNALGTCAIEVLTLEYCAKIWQPFAQDVLNKWMELRNFDGQKLNIRPHWAKEWHDFSVDGKPFLDYLKNEAYHEEVKQFKDILTSIGKKQGWELADLKKRFSNEMLDKLILFDVA